MIFTNRRRRIMKKWSIYIAMLLLSACASDELVVPGRQQVTTPIDEGKATVRISFIDPDSPVTRALTDEDERRIDSLHIFVFKKGATPLQDTYVQKISVPEADLQTDPQDQGRRTKSFPIDTTELQRFILVANFRTSALNLEKDVTTADALIRQLRFSRSDYGDWKTSPPEPFPLWGAMEAYYRTFPPSPIDIDMKRAVARIDVGVDINNHASGDPALGFGSIFEIDSVYLCNVNDSGYVAPIGKIASKKVDAGYKYLPDGRIMARTIYAAETDSLMATQRDSACLVIKARFYNQPNPTPYYYRIDFTKNNEYKPLLRNHNYTINITGIRTVGYRTLEEAKNALIPSLNPHLILGNEEEGINDIAYLDNYWLGCYSTDMKMDWFEQQSGISVGTSYPGGWKAEVIEGSTWFTLPSASAGTGSSDLIYKRTENHTGKPRTATVKLTAGALTQLIKVMQSPGSNTYILQQGGTINIPLSSANIDGIDRASSITSADSYDLFSSAATGTNIQGGVVTATYPNEGVYRIQALSNGSMVWVWTVWVVADGNINTSLHYNGYSFMDRNLGALTGSGFRAGLYYQWGRKDPASPLIANFQTAPAPPNMDEKEIAKYPATFYTSATAPYDWMSAGQHNNLWTTIDGEKGPYDPCPFGWRVPVASNDDASPFAGFTNGQNGINFNIAGTRSGYSGIDASPINTGKATVWGASARGTSAYIYNVTDHAPGTARRADAYPIRCVKDVKRIGY
jgi:hypothetical protein